MFGKNLYKLRTYNGYTQQEIADYIGVHKSTVQHWEHNRREPSAKNAYKLSIIFGVPLEYLCRRGEQRKLQNLNRNYKLIIDI